MPKDPLDSLDRLEKMEIGVLPVIPVTLVLPESKDSLGNRVPQAIEAILETPVNLVKMDK